MTVKELIPLLRAMPEWAEVVMRSAGDRQHSDPETVTFVTDPDGDFVLIEGS